jgi:translation elongation factor P/translation initiation factor 5A
MNDKYYDVVANESKHSGRQAGYIKMDASEILTGKKEHFQLSASARINKIDLVKEITQVQYVDKQTQMLVCADAEFNTVEVPLVYVKDVVAVLEPGDAVTVVKDSENGKIVKCQFSGPIQMKARNLKK